MSDHSERIADAASAYADKQVETSDEASWSANGLVSAFEAGAQYAVDACAAIAKAVMEEHLPASQSPVDPIRNIGHAQVAVARRIMEEIMARGKA